MALTNYTELQDAVANWLDRDDLDARIPEFIALAEARMGRELRKSVVVAPVTFLAGDQYPGLPGDCAELRSVRYNQPGAGLAGHLQITTPWGLDQYRDLSADIPMAAAVAGDNLLLNVEPASDYTMELVYFRSITPLSNDEPSNPELLAAPDLYLFAALCEAAPFLEHDERVGLWESKYLAALKGVNAARESAELGAGPVTMALPVVFG